MDKQGKPSGWAVTRRVFAIIAGNWHVFSSDFYPLWFFCSILLSIKMI